MQDPKGKDAFSKKKVSINNHTSQVVQHENKSQSSEFFLDSSSCVKNDSEECVTDLENEVQVVDLQTGNQQPLLVLFPDLRQEGVNIQELNSKISTTDMTKMLLGKKAQFGNFKHSQKFMKNLHVMPTILESETSFSDVNLPTSTKNVPRERAYSRDADAENEE